MRSSTNLRRELSFLPIEEDESQAIKGGVSAANSYNLGRAPEAEGSDRVRYRRDNVQFIDNSREGRIQEVVTFYTV